MTTIATDGQSMAADGMVCCEGRVTDIAFPKIIRLPDGRIVGGSGSAYDLQPFCDWLMDPKSGKPKLGESSEFLVLHPDGSVLSYNADCRSIREPKLTASGSGARFAIGALFHGATPGEAVNIACKCDTHSGGRIKVAYLTPRLEEAA